MSHSADTGPAWVNGGGGAGSASCGVVGRHQILIPPGEYRARVRRFDPPVFMFGRWILFVSCMIEGVALVAGEHDRECADYYVEPDGYEVFRAYNVNVADGHVVVGGRADLAREWSRVTGLPCPADGRVDLQLLVGQMVRVRVATVEADRDRDPLPPQTRYSKAAKILELPA